MATTQKTLTDAEKNRQAIINKTTTGMVQGKTPVTTTVTPTISVSKQATYPANSTTASSSSQDLTIPTPQPSKLEQEVSNMSSGSWTPQYTTGANGQVTSTDPQTIAYMNWVSKQSMAGVDSSQLTPDKFTASGMAENANQSQVGYTESLGLQGTITSQDIKTYGSYENAVVQKQLLQNEADRHNLEEQNKQAGRASDLASEEENKQAEGAKSAMASAFASGREGVMSASNALLSPEFSASVNNKLEQNSISRGLAENQRNQVYQQLLDAQASGNDKLAESLSKQVSAYDTQIQQIKAEQKKINDEASAEAFDRITKLSALSKDSGGGIFTGWTPQDIATAFNIPLGNATIVANADAKLASMDTSDIDYAQKVANLKKTQQEAIYSGMSPEQRNFTFAQSLTGADKDAFLNFAGKNPTFGFTTIGNKIFATDPHNGTVTQLTGNTTGGTKITPSGKMVSGEVNGKIVTLDQSALFGLQAANGAAEQGGIGGISISSSTRDQKQTIITMAAKWGVDVDPASLDSVNMAAAKLTAMGHPVATVGNSNHEYGLAVDVYPSDPASQSNAKAQAYIEKIKPFMEANGWKQSTDPNDKGHFNFVGATIYSDEQKAVMDNINPTKFTAQDSKTLADADLSFSDLSMYKKTQGITPEQTKLAANIKEKNQIVLDTIDKIINTGLYKGAGYSGAILGKWSMTTNDLQAALDTITSNLALDEMKTLKDSSKTGSTGFGALSEKELTVITSSKGALRVNMSEDMLKSNLATLKQSLMRTNGLIDDKTAETAPKRQLTDQSEIQAVYSQLQTLSEEEGRSLLESKGIDSSQFYN